MAWQRFLGEIWYNEESESDLQPEVELLDGPEEVFQELDELSEGISLESIWVGVFLEKLLHSLLLAHNF